METYAFSDKKGQILRLISMVVFFPLGIWMIYILVRGGHPNGPIDAMDFTFTAVLFLVSAVELCDGIGPSLISTLIKRPIPQRGDETRPGELYKHSGKFFLNIFLIIRFCAWLERFKAKDERVNVGFCIACIVAVGVCFLIACILKLIILKSTQIQNGMPVEIH